ncbi:MAG: hypothetical protein HFI87_02100 [Bacilli bacterium]|nr:hypothetical protein [Bacilli bacterium]
MSIFLGLVLKLGAITFAFVGVNELIEKFTGNDLVEQIYKLVTEYIPGAFKFLVTSIDMLKTTCEYLPTELKTIFISFFILIFSLLVIKFFKK